VVITDIMMPVMNGLELCEELRADPKTQDIRIILMTAGRLSDCQCPGAQFLAKPFDLATLEEAVAEASAAGNSGPAPGPTTPA
jgi:CheY-like chemotaxis protein